MPQAFDEDLHVTAVGGGDVAIILLGRQSERRKLASISASCGLYHRLVQYRQTNFLVEGFYTDLRNVFVLEEIGRDDDQNNIIMERRNGKGARVMGLTWRVKLRAYEWMQVQAGFYLAA